MIVFLAGPIEFWWDSGWDTPEHWRFVEWRNELSKRLVARGHLVYRPHEAFKGAWEPNGGAQAVNNRGLELADVVLVSNYDPPVRCNGTDAEVRYTRRARRGLLRRRRCHAQVVDVIVPHDPAVDVADRVTMLVNGLEDAGVLDRPPVHPEYAAPPPPPPAGVVEASLGAQRREALARRGDPLTPPD